MGCLPVRGDNPRALASGLSYIQADRHAITIYIPYISVDPVQQHEIVRAKVKYHFCSIIIVSIFESRCIYFLKIVHV